MPLYSVWCPELGQTIEDGKHISEDDPYDAATFWAQWHDQSGAEYRLASGSVITVNVRRISNGFRRISNGETLVMEVTGEAVPTYRARVAPLKG